MARDEQQLVSVVIVSYNTAEVLHDCLASLLDAHCGEVSEVIVVDNASADRSVKMVRRQFPDVRLIVNEQNRGFGIANNQGVAAASGKYVLLLNSDTIVRPGAIERLVEVLECEPRVGLVGPRLVDGEGRRQRSAFRFPTPPILLAEQLSVGRFLPAARDKKAGSYVVDWLLGACLLARRDLLAAFGPFDPDFFMYAEDIDLCYRARLAGWEVRLVLDVTITHLGGESARREHVRMGLQSTESMYLFYRKHYSPHALLLATIIFLGVALLKSVRDAARWLGLALVGSRSEQRRQLLEDLRLWARVLQLRPQPVVSTGERQGR